MVQAAHDADLVKIFVDRVPSDCIKLETRMLKQFSLTSCTVVPDSDMPLTMDGTMSVVASAGARFLHGRLEKTEPMVIGIGSGRTMSEVVRMLPRIKRQKAEFVSATGDFATLSAANPFEVIHALLDKTHGKGFAFTAPLVVDEPDDRELFLRQKSVQRSFAMLRSAAFIMIGIGHLGPGSFFQQFGLLNDEEQADLARANVTTDLAGNLVDGEGNFIDTGIARRMLGMERELLRSRDVIAVCAGMEKWKAARAALRTGCLNGFVTSRRVAERILDEDAV
ncbi:sugar-binding domain-containing protein [Ruegeria sp. SCPT10]|uniref:sugar-binding transcriptional regulator n=1 Tax=Ruegeria sp. SCP10 TaxID=3141377 RepID=UPI0033377FF3